MTKRSDEKYVADMLQYAREARQLSIGITIEEFRADRTLQLALAHLVQIVGEAASRISQSARATIPELPWDDMAGMRHRLVHDYGHVNYNLVWDVVDKDLPTLISALEKFVTPDPNLPQ